METAEKGKINFITNMIYQEAQENDSKIHEKIKEGNGQRGLSPKKIFADSNYIGGKFIKEYRENGQELMGYMQENGTVRDKDFRNDKFIIDMKTYKTKCPAGKQSINSYIQKDGRINVYFSRDDCLSCIHFDKCVGVNIQQKRRRLFLSPFHDYIKERRTIQRTEEFKKEMSVRAQVEGTISEATRFHGLRYAKYKSKAGHQFQFYLTGASLNVKRIIKALIHGRNYIKSEKVKT